MPPRTLAPQLAASLALLASSTAMAIEEPSFRVLEQDGAFELREYAPHLLAETRVEASFTTPATSPSSDCSATSAATTPRSRRSQ